MWVFFQSYIFVRNLCHNSPWHYPGVYRMTSGRTRWVWRGSASPCRRPRAPPRVPTHPAHTTRVCKVWRISNPSLGIMRWSNTVGGDQIQWSPKGFVIDLIMPGRNHLKILKKWFFNSAIYIIFSNCTTKYINSHWWDALDYTIQNRFVVLSQTKTLESIELNKAEKKVGYIR